MHNGTGSRRLMLRSLLAAAALGTAARWACADVQYNVADIYSFGGDQTVGAAINNHGQVVGYGTDVGGNTHAFLYSNGNLISLVSAVNDNNYSQATGINDSGQVSGYASPSSTSFPRAFIYDANTGSATILGTLGGTYNGGYSAAYGINATGVVAGSAFVHTSAQEHAFIYDPATGIMSDIGTLGSDLVSAARFINYYGQVAGVSTHAIGGQDQTTFLYDNGSKTDVGALINTALGQTTLFNSPSGINDLGTIVGDALTGSSFTDPNSTFHVFIYDNYSKSVTILENTLGGISTTANGVNAEGTIVGASWDGSVNRAYLYNPFTQSMTDLNTVSAVPAGWTFNSAQAVNDNGQIVVTGISGSIAHTFILSPVSAHSAAVSSNPNGDPNTISVLGGSGTPGGVSATFNISSGTFSADYETGNVGELSIQYPGLDFALPSGSSQIQYWSLLFEGNLNDAPLVTFTYDPTLLAAGIDEADLRIYHFENGVWILPEGETVDIASHTISFYTASFSPFALGLAPAAVPEPASLALLAGGAMLLVKRKR